MIAHTLRTTFELMLLRRGPQDLPASWNLLVGLGVLYCIAAFIQVRLVAPVEAALFQSLLATGLLAFYVHALLQVRKLSTRFVQTLSALYALGIVLTILMLGPTVALAPFLAQLQQASDPQSVGQPPALVLLAYVVVGLWALTAFGNVYRHALQTGLGFGMLLALGFELLLVLVFALLGAAV